MSSVPPPPRAAPHHPSPVPTPLWREVDRARRMRRFGVGAAALVVLAASWAFGVQPAGIELLDVVAAALLLMAVLYGLEVALAEWHSHRLLRLAATEHQRRLALVEALARSDAVDVAARDLAGAMTQSEAADRLLMAAQRLVRSGGGALLVAAADDLVISMSADAADGVPTVTPEAEQLAGWVRTRGVSARSSPGSAPPAVDGRPRVAVPLRAGAEVVGAMVLERGTGDADFTTTEQRVLERLAPHGARALERSSGSSVDRRTVAHDRSASPRDVGGVDAVDLAALVHEVADEQVGVAGELAGRVVVLASASSPIRTDGAALRTALKELLRCVDAHAPDGAAMAVELLPLGREVEIVVAHAGAVLPDRALDEALVHGDGTAPLRQAIIHLGGTVTARQGSGMAQVRVRLPVAGSAMLELQRPAVPVDTSVRASDGSA